MTSIVLKIKDNQTRNLKCGQKLAAYYIKLLNIFKAHITIKKSTYGQLESLLMKWLLESHLSKVLTTTELSK